MPDTPDKTYISHHTSNIETILDTAYDEWAHEDVKKALEESGKLCKIAPAMFLMLKRFVISNEIDLHYAEPGSAQEANYKRNIKEATELISIVEPN